MAKARSKSKKAFVPEILAITAGGVVAYSTYTNPQAPGNVPATIIWGSIVGGVVYFFSSMFL